jgi:hypothetical protein
LLYMHVGKKRNDLSQVRWYTPVIPVLRWLGQEDRQCEPSLGYIVRPGLGLGRKGEREGR